MRTTATVALVLCGCAGQSFQELSDARWAEMERTTKQTTAYFEAQAKQHEAECKRHPLRVGMTAAQALNSCHGRPDQVNRLVTGHATVEQWIYGSSSVYLRDGVVVAFQD